jgi:hypothetical protein
MVQAPLFWLVACSLWEVDFWRQSMGERKESQESVVVGANRQVVNKLPSLSDPLEEVEVAKHKK